jgi:hypothetical protein
MRRREQRVSDHVTRYWGITLRVRLLFISKLLFGFNRRQNPFIVQQHRPFINAM